MLALAAATALAAAPLAPTKEGARARLTARLPLGAPPGATIRIGWKVDAPDGHGGRQPFGARGMFVRLLSRTGAASTTAADDGRTGSVGRYTARVRVPAGGIGGIRTGLHGWNDRGPSDLLFPLENDPFASPGGVRCDVSALRATLTAFVRAYNRGDSRVLDRLFSRARFVWYSSGEPGARLLGEASSRHTLVAYFRRRHAHGDRLALRSFRFNGYERGRDLGHFELSGRRRADDFDGGRWFRLEGKGALDCAKPPVTIAVMSVGAAG